MRRVVEKGMLLPKFPQKALLAAQEHVVKLVELTAHLAKLTSLTTRYDGRALRTHQGEHADAEKVDVL